MWTARPVFISSTFLDMQAERDYLRALITNATAEAAKARTTPRSPTARAGRTRRKWLVEDDDADVRSDWGPHVNKKRDILPRVAWPARGTRAAAIGG
jgi:hypothetical protein